MGRADYYKHGSWNAICDVCGRKFKGDELLDRWDGLKVCRDDYEERHPQEFVRGVVDNPSPPFVRPWPPDTFVIFCTLEGRSTVSGYSIAGCWIAGLPYTGG